MFQNRLFSKISTVFQKTDLGIRTRTLICLLLLVFLMVYSIFESLGQGLVITEISQGESGNKEYVELLVVGSEKCSVVDLRSWIVDDNNGDFGTSGISRGYIKFTDDILWSRVISGTTILLWNTEDTSLVLKQAGLDIIDTDPNDFLIVMPVGCKNVGTLNQSCPSSQYVVGVTNIPTTANPSYNYPFAIIATTFRWNTLIAFGNSADAVQVRKPDGSFFMGLGYGTNVLHPFSGTYGSNTLTFSPVANTYYLNNAFSQDPNDKQNWSTGTLRTPGSPNSVQNQTYIQSIQVDDDCTLDIRFPEEEDSDYREDLSTEVRRYYSVLGQEIRIEDHYNEVVIEEQVFKNGDLSRRLVVVMP